MSTVKQQSVYFFVRNFHILQEVWYNDIHFNGYSKSVYKWELCGYLVQNVGEELEFDGIQNYGA